MARKPVKKGDTFGRLTVLSEISIDERRVRNRRQIVCKCECGSVVTVSGCSLFSGDTKSCGCIHFERAVSMGKAKRTHGMSNTPTTKSYYSMMARCYKKYSASYRYYGAVGITVCKQWRSGFPAFFNDMGVRPKGRTLDRINNSKGYCKSNCRWASLKQQARNRKSSVQITIGGKTKTVGVWLAEYGMYSNTYHHRVTNLGWSKEKAITTPSCKRSKLRRKLCT